jgi:membrane complex biogenesis BtpA family protein
MIHLPPLPGSPRSALPIDAIVDFALRDAEALAEGGVDGLMVENFGDAPFYPGAVPPHTVAHIARVAAAVKRRFELPLGVNVLRNDGLAALGVAAAVGARYIRINVFTGARVTDQGIVEGAAHRVLRERKLLGADVRIFADVAVKHSSPLGPRPLEDEVEDTVRRAGADAVIVSGAATGKATATEDLRCAKLAAGAAPVLIGSGAEAEGLEEALRFADGLIVGSALKQDGVATHPVDRARVTVFMRKITEIRQRYAG